MTPTDTPTFSLHTRIWGNAMTDQQSALLELTRRMQRAGLILSVHELSPTHRQLAYALQTTHYSAPEGLPTPHMTTASIGFAYKGGTR